MNTSWCQPGTTNHTASHPWKHLRSRVSGHSIPAQFKLHVGTFGKIIRLTLFFFFLITEGAPTLWARLIPMGPGEPGKSFASHIGGSRWDSFLDPSHWHKSKLNCSHSRTTSDHPSVPAWSTPSKSAQNTSQLRRRIQFSIILTNSISPRDSTKTNTWCSGVGST